MVMEPSWRSPIVVVVGIVVAAWALVLASAAVDIPIAANDGAGDTGGAGGITASDEGAGGAGGAGGMGNTDGVGIGPKGSA